MVDFQSVIYQWQDYGLYTVILPFLLIFALVFAVLSQVHILGQDKKVHVIVSLIMGLLAIQSEYIVYVMNNFIPNVSMLLIVIIMLLIVAGLIFSGSKEEEWKGLTQNLAMLIAAAGIIFALLFDNITQTLELPYWLQMSDQAKANVFVVGGIILAIWWITKSDNKKKKRGVVVRPEGSEGD